MKRCLSLCAALIIIFFNSTISVNAEIIENGQETSIKFDQSDTIQPHADEIVKKYRNHRGKRQYRRWNVTRGHWVDPYWINLT